MLVDKLTLLKKCPYSELFWSAFSHIRTEYGEIQCISPYSVRMRENAGQNNSEYGHFSRSVNHLYWRLGRRPNEYYYYFLFYLDLLLLKTLFKKGFPSHNNFFSPRRLGRREIVTPKTSWKHLKNILKTNKYLLGILLMWHKKTVSYEK